MSRALVLPTLLLGGCCCCGFGGGGGGGGPSGGIGDRFGDEMREGAMERIIEASSGGDVDISTSDKMFRLETDEGTVTTYLEGSLPDGFVWTLPSGTKVVTATRFDPKDPADGGPAWMVSYETAQDWHTVAAYWQAEAKKRGYKVTSTSAALKAAMAEAAAHGSPVGMVPGGGEPTSDMLVFETTDPNKSGGAMIDGSQPGKTTVVLTVR